jgi:transcriptional regulator with XRE-family HTH domain
MARTLAISAHAHYRAHMVDDPVATLIQLAAAKGVSMAAICKKAGVAQSTPSRWAAGADPKLKTIRKLDTALAEILRHKAG